MTLTPSASLIHLSIKQKQPLYVSSAVLWDLRLPSHKIFKQLPNFEHLNLHGAQSSNTEIRVQTVT